MKELLQERSGPKFSSMEMGMMLDPESPRKNLQYSMTVSQEYSRSQPFGIGGGRFPLMKDAGDYVYRGWKVDPSAPKEFWFSRRDQILEGIVPDIDYFVPLLPDLENFFKYPREVIKAYKEWKEARRKYGNGFRFVFTCGPDPREEKYYYQKELYVFSLDQPKSQPRVVSPIPLNSGESHSASSG